MSDVLPEDVLKGLQGDEEIGTGRRTVDWATRASSNETYVTTPFLDPMQQQVVRAVLRRIDAVSFQTFGGYAKAERKRFVIFPHYALAESIEQPIGVIEIRVEGGRSLSHRDVLGTLLGTGVERDRIGDIIMTSEGCHVVVGPEVQEVFLNEVDRVGREAVKLDLIDPEQIEGAYDRIKEIRTTVASLRLDAIASSGFGDSRTKISRDIRGDRVKLNWKSTKDPAKAVEPGDVISVRGRGRVTFKEVTGKSRKGRIGVVLERHL